MDVLKTIKRRDGWTLHIINRKTPYQPFVVCWNYDGATWDWGTYCDTLEQAEIALTKKCEEHGFYQ